MQDATAPVAPVLVEATAVDTPTLWLMLTYAATMGEGGAARVPEAKADPYLRTYVEGWGSRADDIGVIARVGGEDVGAAWLRSSPHDSPFKLGAEGAPELATAVSPAWRGRGIGAALMRELVVRARGHVDAIVLSVRADNPAARFYARLGFRETSRLVNRVGGESLAMRLELGGAG
jgi:ribosomal protein S18 acetylase RimI-like enzyme